MPEVFIEDDTDYVLPADVPSVWISVGSVSIYIRRSGAGVLVDAFRIGEEDDDNALLDGFSVPAN